MKKIKRGGPKQMAAAIQKFDDNLKAGFNKFDPRPAIQKATEQCAGDRNLASYDDSIDRTDILRFKGIRFRCGSDKEKALCVVDDLITEARREARIEAAQNLSAMQSHYKAKADRFEIKTARLENIIRKIKSNHAEEIIEALAFEPKSYNGVEEEY